MNSANVLGAGASAGPRASFRASIYCEKLLKNALSHRCASHQFFSYIKQSRLDQKQVAALLRNYDAHASHLRRLLLKACAIMPDPAVGYILENVRNEFGNGAVEACHQRQLRDLAERAGVNASQWSAQVVQPGVRDFIKKATIFYCPNGQHLPSTLYRPAIAAGAIVATEILAVEEFKVMHQAFVPLALGDHVWFDHLKLEAAHTDESLNLAAYFIDEKDALEAVEYGLNGILDANVDLYDGLLSALKMI